MGFTIATHNGSAVARDHNIRNKKIVSKEKHINPDGLHETWIDEKPTQAYERLFGKAVADYNSRQTREDRKIKNYYSDICKDAKKHPVYEMIVGIGNRDNRIDEKTGREIMREFVDGWQERNPNLELIGAYYHADEEGVPHVHCDYIPVAHGYTRGMETQTGLVKALGEMGFRKQGKATAQIQWEQKENNALETLCKARGLTIDHPHEENIKHMHTDAYKASQRLTEAQQEYERYVGEIKTAKEIQEIAGKPSLLHKDQITIKRSDYDSLKKTAAAVENVLEEQELINFDLKEIERMKRATAKAKDNADRLEKERQRIVEQQKDIIRRHLEKQAQNITDKLQQFVMQQLNGIDKDKKKKYDRMENFLRKCQFPDGTNGLERFEQSEQDLAKRQHDEMKKSVATTMAMYERLIRDNVAKDMDNLNHPTATRQHRHDDFEL